MQRQAWAARAELALALREARQALQIAEQLSATALNLDGGKRIPRLAWLRGQALAALGQRPDAEAAFHEAEAAARARGLRPLHWRILADLSQLSRAQRRSDLAGAVRDEAAAAIAALAAQVPEASLREGFTREALARRPRRISSE